MNITIGWLYPELMSTYGDRGNIFVFKKRCQWRGIKTEVTSIDFRTTEKELHACDLVFGGGAQDRQQGMVIDDLRKNKGLVLKKLFENGVPGLFVCGSPQLLGQYYMNGDGETLQGLGIFDMVTKHFGKDRPRCIGNIICEVSAMSFESLPRKTIVGFENHGGRTYLGEKVAPFARVIHGFGNNGEDKTEGAVYNNCIATYCHGPFLPKNPHIADWLITKALEVKYKKRIELPPLNDELEWKAHDWVIQHRQNQS